MTAISILSDSAGRLMELPKAMRRYWARELARNPRLQGWILIVGIILLVQSWFLIDDSHQRQRREIAAVRQQLTALSQLAGATEWRERREGVERVRAQLENRLWTAESDGLAQADFQDMLVKLAQANGLSGLECRVELVASPGNALKLRQISASIGGSFDAAALQLFLAALARDRHVLVVDRLHVDITTSPRFDMVVSTFLRPGTAGPRGSNPARRS